MERGIDQPRLRNLKNNRGICRFRRLYRTDNHFHIGNVKGTYRLIMLFSLPQ